AQQQMKYYADKKRRDVHFAVGEWVFLKLRPHRQQSVVRRINQKLAARYYGPFQIIAKKAIGNYQAHGELPKELDITLEEDIYPEKILGSRVTLQGGSAVPQSLIQWRNKSLEDVTWEDDAFLTGQFPEFSLEDKALFETGGIDREVGLDVNDKPKIWRVYAR
ncbi:hypothetical protein A2U01_0045756, partial [Trifolium medium]|nr:hypothetical protein [Trifolium medium]